MAVNSGLGATEMLRSHVNARAIEAVCRLTANSLDLETLMRIIPCYCFVGMHDRFRSRANRDRMKQATFSN